MFRPSARIARTRISASAAAAQRARELRLAGVDVLELAQGEPDFNTPDHVIEAAYRAMKDGQTHYTPTDGTVELKAAIIGKFRRENGLTFKPENISAGAGGKQVLHNALMVTLDPGDEVVIPAPSWVAYADITHYAEGVPVWVPTKAENGFKLQPAELEAAITPRTKWLMLNSPSNPSGAVLSANELRGLVAVLERHPHVWVIADDIYEHVLFDGRPFAMLAAIAPQLASRTLTVNGCSKSYAMTGWRLGYGAGPAELIRAMARLQAQSSLNPSSVSQAAAVAALNGPQDIVRERCAIFQSRRDKLVPRLNAIPGLSCVPPDGAFYAYVSCAGWLGRRTPQGRVLENDADVTAYLLESGVALPNGAGYGLSPYFRVSFAAAQDFLDRACSRIEAAAAKLV
ncbi:MAG: aminotransferase class I/II-fold pyridoxal phosphate-dependent enzyme [Proteobacteria bacterium]|nr:aminotransferase class I/II-fold pyridoxal phosphate-dependent enzyme [Pseudomonadota bacterium]MDA0982599.1 aminotransferase class I/II-fold pyridoxal phosphate-dependent enzyme [Pseudomonadota bacterium]